MAWLLPQLPPHFQAALRDVNAQRPESRIAAAERLGQADDDERDRALDGLIKLSADDHPDVRATALAALGMLADTRALDCVLSHMKDTVPGVREFAALAAAQIGGDRALTALREALRSDTPQVRFQAVAAVAELSPETAAREIIPHLSDADAEVRAQAVAALAGLDEHHLVGHLAGVLDDEDANVRLEAALALANMDDKRGEPVLLWALETRTRVHEVCGAIAHLGLSSAREPLAKIALSFFAAPDVRAATGGALVKLGDPRGLSALGRVLRGLRSDARSYAVELVGVCDALALVPDLVRLVDRPRGTDPFTLVTALSAFAARDDAARSALQRLGQRTDDIGQAARRALDQPAPDVPVR
jgi:HEAT repeat protein